MKIARVFLLAYSTIFYPWKEKHFFYSSTAGFLSSLVSFLFLWTYIHIFLGGYKNVQNKKKTTKKEKETSDKEKFIVARRAKMKLFFSCCRLTNTRTHKRNFIFYEGGNAVYLNFKRKFLLSLDIQLSSCLEHRENKTLEVVFNSQIR